MSITKRFDGGREDILPDVPRPPTTCSAPNCREDIVVLFCIAICAGKERKEFFSHFGRVDNKQLIMKPGVTFVRWVGYCAAHYMQKADELNTAHLPVPVPRTAAREYLEAHADHAEKVKA